MSFLRRFCTKPVFAGTVYIAAVFSCFAQTAPKPPPDIPSRSKELVIKGAGSSGKMVDVKFGKSEVMRLEVGNASDRTLTLTHVGVNTPTLLVPITPIALAPNESKPFELVVDSTRMPMPGQLILYFSAQHAESNRLLVTELQYSSRDMGVIHPRSLTWKVNDEIKAKRAKLVVLPENVKVTGIRVSSEAFSASIEKDRISIVPIGTTQPLTATATLVTEPELSKPAVIYLAVAAAQSGGPDQPAVSPKKTSNN